jgi:hypothetical protein
MAHFKAYKNYFLAEHKNFMTNSFFILRQKLKPITRIYFYIPAPSITLKLGRSVANKASFLCLQNSFGLTKLSEKLIFQLNIAEQMTHSGTKNLHFLIY